MKLITTNAYTDFTVVIVLVNCSLHSTIRSSYNDFVIYIMPLSDNKALIDRAEWVCFLRTSIKSHSDHLTTHSYLHSSCHYQSFNH